MKSSRSAKAAVAIVFDAHSLRYDAIRARTISFQDLARSSAIEVTVIGVSRDAWLEASAKVRNDIPAGILLELEFAPGPATR
jgi:hypothetical protein